MSDPKLFVMQKKMVKFIKASLLRKSKEKLLMDHRSFRNRFFVHKQQRLGKNHHHLNRPLCWRRDRGLGRALDAVFRSVSTDLDSRLPHLPLLTSFCRALLSHPPKDLTGHRNLSLRSANDSSIPSLTRGFKANTTCPASLSQTSCRKTTTENDAPVDATPRRLTNQCDGTAEQRYYTEGLPANRRAIPQPLQGETQLPPPLRCRLSCPLPPLEFIPMETTPYLPNHRSTTLRFSNLPPDLLPPGKTDVSTRTEKTTFRSRHHPKKFNPPPTTPATLLLPQTLPDFFPKPIKNKKTYFNLEKLRSRLQQSQPEVVPKMKALLFEPESLALDFHAVNAPAKIFKDEVLVQVSYSGVCGTDLFITEGKVSCGTSPVILGHEISGKVYAVGSDVHHVVAGDHIAVNAYTACSVCRYCSRGLYSACVNDGINNCIGISKNGGWAEFVVVKKSQVYKIPQELGLDQAALIQSLSCILSALSKLNVTHGTEVLIQGLGLSGCLWASVLHSKGLRKVLVSERNERKRMQYECLELGYPFVPAEDVGKLGVDVIIECTGSPTSIERALNVLNPNGQMCFFGKPNPMAEVRCIPYEIIKKEITIVGNAGNGFCFSKAIDLATSMGPEYLDFEKLGVRAFDLEDYKEAFHMKKLGEVNKIVFKFDS